MTSVGPRGNRSSHPSCSLDTPVVLCGSESLAFDKLQFIPMLSPRAQPKAPPWVASELGNTMDIRGQASGIAAFACKSSPTRQLIYSVSQFICLMEQGSQGRRSIDGIKPPGDACSLMLPSLACELDLRATRWLLCLQVSYLHSRPNKRGNGHD